MKREVVLTICNKAGIVHKTQHRGTFANHCSSGKAINITYSESVFVALGTEREIRMLHFVICGLPGSTIFFHIIINGTIFGNKMNIKLFFLFSLELLSETVRILSCTERDMIKNVYWSSCKLSVILVRF